MCYILIATYVAQGAKARLCLLVAAKEVGLASTPPLQPNNLPLTTLPCELEIVFSV